MIHILQECGSNMNKHLLQSFVDNFLKRIHEAESEGKPFFWVQPWRGYGPRFPVNYVTENPYHGINAVSLEPGEYLTRKQIEHLGGSVKNNAEPHEIVFFKYFKKTVDDKERVFRCLKYYTVYNLKDVLGVESKFPDIEDFDELQGIEERLDNFIERFARENKIILDISKYNSKCSFNPASCTIFLPTRSLFSSTYSYYSAVLHEIVHSTALFLNRKLSRETSVYQKEELIAQIGAEILLNYFGIIPSVGDEDNDIAYVREWCKKVKNIDKTLLSASIAAQKAANYVISFAERG